MSLPQLKQVTSDKEELVTNIVEMASKFNFCHWTEGLDRGVVLAELYNNYCMFVINRKKPSDGATAGRKKTRDALQGEILRLISCCVSLFIQILLYRYFIQISFDYPLGDVCFCVLTV